MTKPPTNHQNYFPNMAAKHILIGLLLALVFPITAMGKTYFFDNYRCSSRICYRAAKIIVDDDKKQMTIMLQTANMKWQKEVLTIVNKTPDRFFYRYELKDATGGKCGANVNEDGSYISFYEYPVGVMFEFFKPYKVL